MPQPIAQAIARELSLSVDTVKDHVTALMRSLNVTSRTQAVLAVTGRRGRDEGTAGGMMTVPRALPLDSSASRLAALAEPTLR